MDVHVVQGRYWESPHWSKEFELYIEIYAPKDWRERLIKGNNLQRAKEQREAPADAPGWFRPDGKMELLMAKPGSAADIELYMDTTSGHLLLHAVQL